MSDFVPFSGASFRIGDDDEGQVSTSSGVGSAPPQVSAPKAAPQVAPRDYCKQCNDRQLYMLETMLSEMADVIEAIEDHPFTRDIHVRLDDLYMQASTLLSKVENIVLAGGVSLLEDNILELKDQWETIARTVSYRISIRSEKRKRLVEVDVEDNGERE